MQRELLGLYYMKLPLDSGTIDVTSYCQHEMNFYEMRTFAQVFYPLMEALFEAPHGSLKGFNHEGTPILEEYYGNENTKKLSLLRLWIIIENIEAFGEQERLH